MENPENPENPENLENPETPENPENPGEPGELGEPGEPGGFSGESPPIVFQNRPKGFKIGKILAKMLISETKPLRAKRAKIWDHYSRIYM